MNMPQYTGRIPYSFKLHKDIDYIEVSFRVSSEFAKILMGGITNIDDNKVNAFKESLFEDLRLGLREVIARNN